MFDPRVWFGLLPLPWLFVLVTSAVWLKASHGGVSLNSAQERTAFGKNQSPHERGDRRVRVREGAAKENPRSLFATTRLLHGRNRETAMVCKPEIRRHCRTRAEAHQYLASRGFLFLTHGCANGRWQARLESEGEGVIVSISLEDQAA
jgi:hypothetical protein